jgi:hypothetical protein
VDHERTGVSADVEYDCSGLPRHGSLSWHGSFPSYEGTSKPSFGTPR